MERNEVNEREIKDDKHENKIDRVFSEKVEQEYVNAMNLSESDRRKKEQVPESIKNAKEKFETVENPDDNEVRKVTCINQNLAGKEHPETGVPYEERIIEVEGEKLDVVVPRFESKFEAQLPEDMYKEPDTVQKRMCNSQLLKEIENNPNLKKEFTPTQLGNIREDKKTPEGYRWHHDADPGHMQLVEKTPHERSTHTGGRNFWGGGSQNR